MDGPQKVGYSVTAVTPDQQFGPNGTVIPGKQLTVTTDTGYEGTVFVPNSVVGNMDTVRQIVEDEVRSVLGLRALSGQVGGQ